VIAKAYREATIQARVIWLCLCCLFQPQSFNSTYRLELRTCNPGRLQGSPMILFKINLVNFQFNSSLKTRRYNQLSFCSSRNTTIRMHLPFNGRTPQLSEVVLSITVRSQYGIRMELLGNQTGGRMTSSIINRHHPVFSDLSINS